MPRDVPEGVVYTPSELFERVDRKLDEIKDQLANKADKADIHALTTKYDRHDQRIEKLELQSLESDAIARHRIRNWQLLTAGGGLLASVAIVLGLVVH